MKSVNFILLMISLSIILPHLNAQLDQSIATKPTAVLGMIGFKQGGETIPINGTSIPLNANETVWLLALKDISVNYGPTDRNIISNELVPAGKEVSFRPALIQCCEIQKKYHLRITAQSTLDDYGSFEEASLLYVGSDEARIVTPSLSLGKDSIRIKMDGLSQESPTQLTLLKPGLDESMVTGRYGVVQYRSVVTPQSTMKILYDPSIVGGVVEQTIHFMLISTRTYLSEVIESENIIRMHRDGIVASTSVKLNLTTEGTIPVNLKLASLGEPGTGGDTPLQLGLHFLYIHIEGEDVITREQGNNKAGEENADDYSEYAEEDNAKTEEFIQIYVLKNDGYTILDQIPSSEGEVRLDFTKENPKKMLVVATSIINGVTSSLYSTELMIHMTTITLYDGDQQIYDYTLSFEPKLPSTQVGGVTYVLGETLGDTALLTKVKVFNFTLSSYEISGGRGNEIGFSEILNLTTKLNKVSISTVNDLGESLSNGLVKIEKGDEKYSYQVYPPRTLTIPDGTYTISLIIGENTVEEKSITVVSSQTITLTENTIKTMDVVLLAILLIEIPAVAILGIMIRRSN